MSVLDSEDLQLLDRVAAQVIAPVDPPAHVRAKVMEAMRNVPGAHESRTVRAEEGKWSTIAPGARMKVLSKESGRMTFLIDLDPLRHRPRPRPRRRRRLLRRPRQLLHRRARLSNTGDFHHADATAHHGDVVASADGCLLLLTMTRAKTA